MLENLKFLGSAYSLRGRQLDDRIELQLDRFDLTDRAEQISGTMSGGQRQRLALAAATLHDPELLFLDEPTSAVDPESRRDFWDHLFEMVDHGTTILVSTHFMDEAERCHRLAILNQGRLVADGVPDDLMRNVGATVVQIESAVSRSIRNAILELPDVWHVAQLGNRLHALVRPDLADPVAELKIRIGTIDAAARGGDHRCQSGRRFRDGDGRGAGSRCLSPWPTACGGSVLSPARNFATCVGRAERAMIFGIPLVMTLLFGYAINHDVRHLPAAVVDQAETSGSRLLLAKIQASRVVDIVERFDSVHALETALAQGRISVGIFVPADFERRVHRRDRPLAQLLIDGSDPVVQSAAKSLQLLPLIEGAGSSQSASGGFELRVYYNPERRSPVFIVPGLTGVILNLTMVLFTAVAIVRERERGNMELLITTPIGGLELMLGKDPAVHGDRLSAGYGDHGAGRVAVQRAHCRQPVRLRHRGGAVHHRHPVSRADDLDLRDSNQFQAFQMTFMTFLPQMLLSGFMFPFEGMPIPAQWLAELFPLTHFLRIVRGIVLREADLPLLWQDVWPLLVFFLIFLTAATIRFQKRLD